MAIINAVVRECLNAKMAWCHSCRLRAEEESSLERARKKRGKKKKGGGGHIRSCPVSEESA